MHKRTIVRWLYVAIISVHEHYVLNKAFALCHLFVWSLRGCAVNSVL